ncbi:MAG: hypothetical protein GY754_41800 [bacterium]|nr:hypothetical protein [bacterium]
MHLVYTTFNITLENFELLQSSAKTMGIARSRLVELLIQKVMEKDPFDYKMFGTVKYQLSPLEDEPAVSGAEPWYHCHVVFDSSVYENCLDLRKVHKLSVSAIIAFAINNYLDDLLLSKDPKGDVDKYPHNYIFSEGKYDGIKTFVMFWGVPNQETLQKFLL